jgi:hypothetical protein
MKLKEKLQKARYMTHLAAFRDLPHRLSYVRVACKYHILLCTVWNVAGQFRFVNLRRKVRGKNGAISDTATPPQPSPDLLGTALPLAQAGWLCRFCVGRPVPRLAPVVGSVSGWRKEDCRWLRL